MVLIRWIDILTQIVQSLQAYSLLILCFLHSLSSLTETQPAIQLAWYHRSTHPHYHLPFIGTLPRYVPPIIPPTSELRGPPVYDRSSAESNSGQPVWRTRLGSVQRYEL